MEKKHTGPDLAPGRETIQNNFRSNLGSIRKELGLRQIEYAPLFKLSLANYNCYEKKAIEPRLSGVANFARVLRVKMEDLAAGKEPLEIRFNDDSFVQLRSSNMRSFYHTACGCDLDAETQSDAKAPDDLYDLFGPEILRDVDDPKKYSEKGRAIYEGLVRKFPRDRMRLLERLEHAGLGKDSQLSWDVIDIYEDYKGRAAYTTIPRTFREYAILEEDGRRYIGSDVVFSQEISANEKVRKFRIDRLITAETFSLMERSAWRGAFMHSSEMYAIFLKDVYDRLLQDPSRPFPFVRVRAIDMVDLGDSQKTSIASHFSKKLRSLRGDTPMQDYYRNFKTSLSSYSKYENGAQEPRLHVLVHFAKTLGITIDELADIKNVKEDYLLRASRFAIDLRTLQDVAGISEKDKFVVEPYYFWITDRATFLGRKSGKIFYDKDPALKDTVCVGPYHEKTISRISNSVEDAFNAAYKEAIKRQCRTARAVGEILCDYPMFGDERDLDRGDNARPIIVSANGNSTHPRCPFALKKGLLAEDKKRELLTIKSDY